MTKLFRMKSFLFPSLLSAMVACGNSSGGGGGGGDMGGGGDGGVKGATLQGRVSDDAGSQPQSFPGQPKGVHAKTGSLGGSGTVAASSIVKVSAINADGTLSAVGQGSVMASGSYTVSVPAGQQQLIVQSLDASSNVLASAIVESTGTVGETVTVTPMDTESSVEASVLVQMAANGVALTDLNAIDLRKRINANVASAVNAAASAAVEIKALAESVAAAQQAQVMAYAAVGLTTTQSALFSADLAAALKLDAALNAASSTAATTSAYATFDADVAAALIALDPSWKTHAFAESAASVAFRAAILRRLQGGTADPVADAGVRAAASLESRVVAAAADGMLAADGAAATAVSAEASADATLHSQIAAATTASQATTAFASWSGAVTGAGTISGSVVGDLLAVNLTNGAAAQLAVTSITSAAVTLNTTLNSVKGTISTAGSLDVTALATSVVSAYGTFQASANATVPALTVVFGSEAQAAVDLTAAASSSFSLK